MFSVSSFFFFIFFITTFETSIFKFDEEHILLLFFFLPLDFYLRFLTRSSCHIVFTTNIFTNIIGIISSINVLTRKSRFNFNFSPYFSLPHFAFYIESSSNKKELSIKFSKVSNYSFFFFSKFLFQSEKFFQ